MENIGLITIGQNCPCHTGFEKAKILQANQWFRKGQKWDTDVLKISKQRDLVTIY